jgi:endonuclease YncB( thermonuclease family)
MFWRRKKEGFVWNEYVRTTILVRRDQRRQRVEDIRDAAVDGIKHGARQGAALGVAGASAVGRSAAQVLTAAFHATTDVIAAAGAATAVLFARGLAHASPAVSAAIVRLVETARVPALSVSLLVVGAGAALAASANWGAHGLDATTLKIAALSAAAFAFAAMPRLSDLGLGSALGGLSAAIPGRFAMPNLGALLGYGIPLAVGAGLLMWLAPALTATQTAAPSIATADAVSTVVAASGHIEGKAVAMSGAQLRVAREMVRLTGVEAPERSQVCAAGGGKSGPCAANAKTALQKLVAGKKVGCEISGRGEDGTVQATCEVNGADIAAQMVRGGYVFAASGLFATYASAEREARAAKTGLWRAGEPQRPADVRARIWADAKLAAPDGCPIKGIVAGDAKAYIVPWQAAYEKAKIRTSRGERWFCTEAEARAAGWKPAEPS